MMRIAPTSLAGVLSAVLLTLCAGLRPATAQTTAPLEWTWVTGSSANQTPTPQPVYGSIGVAAEGNTPGGRNGSISWADKHGNAWLFGGAGFDSTGSVGFLNDLWKFNQATSEWTWVAGSNVVSKTNCAYYGQCGASGVYGTVGVFAAGNNPGGITNASGWVDASGNLWLFGGTGYDASGGYDFLNQLWEFKPAAGQWAFMGGSASIPQGGSNCEYGFCGTGGVYGTLGTPAAANVPGSRTGATTWTDAAGNLWLFGGGGWDVNAELLSLNDLWKFNPSTAQWTWVGGSDTGNQSGTYGTLGVASAANIPGGRSAATSWTDANGNFWLLGGSGLDSTGAYGYLNDLWKLSPTTLEWTWMSGGNTAGSAYCQPYGNCGPLGVYGTLGAPAPTNVPGGREYGNGWTDDSGNLWLFGSYGFDSAGTFGYLSDLWEFNTTLNQWVWMGGQSTLGTKGAQPAVYGTVGVPAAGDGPGARQSPTSWTDENGDFWLATGESGWPNSQFGSEWLDDVWVFEPPVPAPAITSADAATFRGGMASAFTVTSTGSPLATLSESGSLPAGITFTNNGNGTATIAGVTTTTGNFPITITAANAVPTDATQQFTLSVTSPIASLTSPAAGSTFGGASVTFNWTAAPGATGYYLWIGSAGVGSNDIYNSAEKTATSYTFPRMPLNGETIYVRLITNLSGQWYSNDYTYTAAQPATLTGPALGSILTGPAATFTWYAAAGSVSGYYLWIGSTGVGSNNIYNSAEKTVTSFTFSGLPVNGETIYVRLITNFDGVWAATDTTYTAASVAAMTAPAAGSVLTGSKATFSWTTSLTATGYYLWIGSTGAGSNDIYNSAEKTVTSYTFNGLPTNGETIYVRLITNLGGAWEHNDYTVKAYTLPAALTTPAVGSTFTGASVAFDWTAPPGATGYYLWIGSTGAGSNNIYNSAEKTTSTYTFTRMPVNGEPIYVRLITNYNGTWVYNDYTYTAK